MEVVTKVAVQDPVTKQWGHYSNIVEIGPHWRYFFCLSSRRVVTCNHRFLHGHYDIYPPNDSSLTKPVNPVPEPAVPTRRLQRHYRRPDRLIEHDEL